MSVPSPEAPIEGDRYPVDKGVENVADLEGDWLAPSDVTPLTQSEAMDVAREMLPALEAILTDPARSADLITRHLHPEAFLRDFVALSWTFRTLRGHKELQQAIPAFIDHVKPVAGSFRIREDEVAAHTLPNDANFVRVPILFRTAQPAADVLAMLKVVRLKSGELKVGCDLRLRDAA
jgi:hypothetical protein